MPLCNLLSTTFKILRTYFYFKTSNLLFFRTAASRTFFEDMQRHFAPCMISSAYLNVDETLYLMRNKINFKVYIISRSRTSTGYYSNC